MDQKKLEALYLKYNKRSLVSPDPLEFLYKYDGPRDVEIVGLVASGLAYGRVAQILKSVSGVLEKMGRSPFGFLTGSSDRKIKDLFRGFRHRFTSGEDLSLMLIGAKSAIERDGSLENLFACGFRERDKTILPALTQFAKGIGNGSNLISLPEKGSACKRLNLFLRWMVRSDDVDLGIWKGVPPSKLIVPLDTHMHKVALALRATRRHAADMQTAMEVTNFFRKISPTDPVKYDFVLTRPGIWGLRSRGDHRAF